MSKNLKRYLEECKAAYYDGNPIISDSQYDNLEDICSEDLTVGTNKGRCKHWYRLYSLDKAYIGEDTPNFNVPALTTFISTPKLDGAAIAVRYVNQYIDSVVTRGNGEYGEDISDLIINKGNLSKLGIPARIKMNGAVQITGEVVAPKYIENARNYAAGALNLKDSVEFWTKEIAFFAYGIRPYITEWYQQDMEWLGEAFFFTIWKADSVHDYPTDGTVDRIDSNELYEKLGYTNKHPRGAVAWKERSEGIKTVIKDVVWQTGKSGKVTPVAILDPINIDGATVSRATLNNVGFIEALEVQIGDSVMVERAGGIIPRIIKKAE
jgi:NAD-dependent DNA ligase